MADKCSIVTEQQWRALGADQPPRELESNGKQGCDYSTGEAGGEGWAVFVAADTSRTMQQFAKVRSSSAKDLDISGYPAVEVGVGDTNCLIAVDVADGGSLFVSSLVRPQGESRPEPCELGKKFAEAAVRNLPDA